MTIQDNASDPRHELDSQNNRRDIITPLAIILGLIAFALCESLVWYSGKLETSKVIWEYQSTSKSTYGEGVDSTRTNSGSGRPSLRGWH